MGSTKNFLPQGGFLRQEYREVASINGIKIIKKIDGSKANLPLYSNTPNAIYAILDENGVVKQIAVYGANRRKIKDIDWNHEIQNTCVNEMLCLEGELNVQEYDKNTIRDSQNARRPTEKEIRLVKIAKSWRE